MPPRKKLDKIIPSSYQRTFQIKRKHDKKSLMKEGIENKNFLTFSTISPKDLVANDKESNQSRNTLENKVRTKSKKKACLRCRRAKVKCINEGAAPCQKCLQSGVECVFYVQVESSSASHVSPLLSNNDVPQKGTNDRTVLINPTNESKNEDKANESKKAEPYLAYEGSHRSREDNLDGVKDTLNNVFNFLREGDFHNNLKNLEQIKEKSEDFRTFLDQLEKKRTCSNGNEINRNKSSATSNGRVEETIRNFGDSLMIQLNHPSFENSNISEYEKIIYGNMQKNCLQNPTVSNGNIANTSNIYNNYPPQQVSVSNQPEYNRNYSKRNISDIVQPTESGNLLKKPKTICDSNETIQHPDSENSMSFELFEKYFDTFCCKIEPYLFGFEIHKFNKIMIFLKSKIMVNLIGFLSTSDSSNTDENSKFKASYYDCVTKILLSSDEATSYEDFKMFNDKVYDSFDENKTSTSKEHSSYDFENTENDYNKYIEFLSRKNVDIRISFRPWDDLSYVEKLEEDKASKQFKLFMKILALILGAFWIESSQRFFGLAVQLAADLNISEIFSKISGAADNMNSIENKEINGNQSTQTIDSALFMTYIVSKIEKLKLWYLLYILDSQQAIFFKKSKIISTTNVIENPRRFILDSSLGYFPQNDEKALLLNSENSKETELFSKRELQSHTLNEKLIKSTDFYNNFNLVSQLEFSKATSLIFQEEGLQLLDMEAFGIPWKTNLDLDKWMVHWTCLLTPINQSGNPWIIKQTILYYNFAKLYLNNELSSNDQHVLTIMEKKNETREADKREGDENERSLVGLDIEELRDEDYHDCEEINTEDIALTSAQTFIEYIVKDNDIKKNLPFCPIHIHIMSYLSAIYLLDSSKYYFGNIQQFVSTLGVSEKSKTRRINLKDIDKDKLKALINLYIEKLVLVKSLIEVLKEFLPLDVDFGKKILKELRIRFSMKMKMMRRISDVCCKAYPIESDSNITPIEDEQDLTNVLTKWVSSCESTPKTKILAWPSTNHGHP